MADVDKALPNVEQTINIPSSEEIQVELENRNSDQWLDINATTNYLRIDVLSAYPGEEFNGKEPFKECAL